MNVMSQAHFAPICEDRFTNNYSYSPCFPLSHIFNVLGKRTYKDTKLISIQEAKDSLN